MREECIDLVRSIEQRVANLEMDVAPIVEEWRTREQLRKIQKEADERQARRHSTGVQLGAYAPYQMVETCLVAHNDGHGQCMKCVKCGQWIRPQDWETTPCGK